MKNHPSSAFVVTLALLGSLTAGAPARAAGPMVEISQPTPATRAVTPASLRQAIGSDEDVAVVQAFAHHQIASSDALDDTMKAMMHTSIDDILNGRILDVELTFLTGYPYLAALCLEGHPTRGLAIEACATTAILVSGFSAAVKYRWDLVAKMTESGNAHQLSFGPGVGTHVNFETSAFGGPSTPTYNASSVDAMASLEYVYWVAKHFGITAQLDLGASYLIYKSPDMPDHAMPYGKLSIGLAF